MGGDPFRFGAGQSERSDTGLDPGDGACHEDTECRRTIDGREIENDKRTVQTYGSWRFSAPPRIGLIVALSRANEPPAKMKSANDHGLHSRHDSR
jgi:hypothetical protein